MAEQRYTEEVAAEENLKRLSFLVEYTGLILLGKAQEVLGAKKAWDFRRSLLVHCGKRTEQARAWRWDSKETASFHTPSYSTLCRSLDQAAGLEGEDREGWFHELLRHEAQQTRLWTGCHSWGIEWDLNPWQSEPLFKMINVQKILTILATFNVKDKQHF